MRPIYLALACGILAVSVPANAQFANHSLGLSTGYLTLSGSDSQIDHGIPIGLTTSLYIEGGFDVVITAPVMILTEQVFNKQVVAIAPSAGLRYLLSEESLRPYVGGDLSFLYIFGIQTTSAFVGLGPNAGIDYFLNDTFSVGAKAEFNAYLMLNAPLQTSFIVTGNVSTWW